MPLSGNRQEAIVTIISVVFMVGLILVLIFRHEGKSGTQPNSQAKVNQSDTSGLAIPNTERQNPKTNEWVDQSMDGAGGLDLPKIREAANTYVETHDSGCAAKGFSSTAINGNFYFVAVDLTCGKRRKIANLVARRFYTLDQKSSYWKADLLSKDVLSLALTERQEGETSQDQ